MAAMAEPGGAPKVQRLVEDLRALQDAVRTLRAAGVEAELPVELVAACRDLVELYEHEQGTLRARSTADDLADIPLRRLVWRVLTPGETFTVPEVVERLANLGANVEAPQVSNALGFWFAREDLQRRRKGVYYYPLPASDPGDRNAAGEPVATKNPGRPRTADREKGQAVAGPEAEDSGDTTRGQEVTRRAG